MARIASVSFVAIAGAAVGQSFNGTTRINDPAFINSLNSENAAASTWVAGASLFFDGMTFDDARSLFRGGELSHISQHLGECLDDSAYAAMADVPESFDSRTNWPGLIHPIRDQAGCGACWAMSASEVLSDRVAIASNKASPVLSPQDLVSCDKSNQGCSGGQFPSAWRYLQNEGIVTETCFPYTSGDGSSTICQKKCVNSESWEASKVKAQNYYAISGVANMQKEIMTNGPIQVVFKVYRSITAYKSGVYQKPPQEMGPLGGHAVKLLGWGTEDSVDYWIVANSWNTSWGMDGFFKIKRGSNECGIEELGPPFAGMPATTSVLVV